MVTAALRAVWEVKGEEAVRVGRWAVRAVRGEEGTVPGGAGCSSPSLTSHVPDSRAPR